MREYTFTVREPATRAARVHDHNSKRSIRLRPRAISGRSGYLLHKLHRELAASENHPQNSHFRLTNEELDDYRTTHMPKPPKYPYAPKLAEEDA